MKNTNKITLCGIMASLSVVIMLLSYFPYLTYAIPAFAGLFIMVCVIEIDCKWALGAYIASCVLVFLFAEAESKILYILFFGHFPIFKSIIERKNFSVIIEWIFKFLVFNVCVITAYFLIAKIFGISYIDMGNFEKYGAVILLILGNIVFVVYDIAISKISLLYINRFHHKIKKLFKN